MDKLRWCLLVWRSPLMKTGHRKRASISAQFFPCRHPLYRRETVTAIARMGAASDYDKRYMDLLSQGIRLVHTPEEYRRTSLLPVWYPLLENLTPRSAWFAQRPPVVFHQGEVGGGFFGHRHKS